MTIAERILEMRNSQSINVGRISGVLALAFSRGCDTTVSTLMWMRSYTNTYISGESWPKWNPDMNPHLCFLFLVCYICICGNNYIKLRFPLLPILGLTIINWKCYSTFCITISCDTLLCHIKISCNNIIYIVHV